jgi:hypothetical protein
MYIRRTILALLVILPCANPAAAQITCVYPSEKDKCTLRVPKHNVSLPLIVHVADSRPGQVVTFKSTGPGSVTISAQADAAGIARAVWTGIPGDVTVITVEAGNSTNTAAREIRILAEGVTPTGRTISAEARSTYWYEDRQMADPVLIRVTPVNGSCENSTVVFRPSALGTVSHDSVAATLLGESCVAQTWWRLGKGLGRHSLSAFLADEPAKRTTVSAVARALPRIGVGMALTAERGFRTVEAAAETIQISRTFPVAGGGDSTVVTRSITETSRIKDVRATRLINPTLNVDFPLSRDIPELRLAIAVSLTSPDKDWYAGINLPQLFFGSAVEHLGVDLHIVTHFGRRDVIRGSPKCEPANPCEKQDTFIVLGYGALVTVDGTGLLGTLTTIFK